MGFVRFIKKEEIVEDMLCYISLPNKTTGEEIFHAVDGMFVKYGLSWQNVVGVCTDGAPSMQGKKKGLIARIEQVTNKKCRFTHCIIHREALAANELSPELDDVMNMVIKMVNSIKSKPLNYRVFLEICEELGADSRA